LAEHLDELRSRLKVVFITFVVIFAALLVIPADPARFLSNISSGVYAPLVSILIKGIEADLVPKTWLLINLRVNEPLEVLLLASLVFAVALDMPVIAYETYRFIDPALKPEERSAAYPFIAASTGLFVAGILFGYFFLSRFLIIALTPFCSAIGLTVCTVDVLDFLSVIFITTLVSGAAFTFPVFVYLLIKFGIVDIGFFRRNRVVIWAATYIVTAVITPDGGPLLDIALFIPIIAMLELSVFLAGRARPARERRGLGRKCRYCSGVLNEGETFCHTCGRSSV
jgi:sec-independent protein translocase protein TatC